MGLYLGVYGTRYDSGEPLYLTNEAGVRVWDRVKHRWLNWASLDAKATEESHTWQPREVGIPSIMWQLANFNGHRYAPGLDDTNGLASEIVTNGELWTGATGTTPPTGWTADGVGETYTDFGGTLAITSDPVLGGGISQVLTGTPGEYYVCEINVNADTTDGVHVGIDGVELPIAPGLDDGSSRLVAFTFIMPASGSATLGISLAAGAYFATRFIRCYLESELTGNPGAIGGGVPVVIPIQDVTGPYSGGGASYYIRKSDCMVGFDLDDNGTPDDWHSGQDVCESSLTDEAKMSINDDLIANGCAALPCMTGVGKLKKKYQMPAKGADE